MPRLIEAGGATRSVDVTDGDYRRNVIGELHETPKGWLLQAPTECINGHPLGPGRMLVGHQRCTCRGGHLSWTCLTCDATFYWPPTDPGSSVLAGAARVR
jgi:hypothetical protein